MHKNIKKSFCIFMSFLMFCQLSGYSYAKVPESIKQDSNISLGQKIKAFFTTTIPNNPGKTAAVGGGVGTLALLLAVLGITKPWKNKQSANMGNDDFNPNSASSESTSNHDSSEDSLSDRLFNSVESDNDTDQAGTNDGSVVSGSGLAQSLSEFDRPPRSNSEPLEKHGGSGVRDRSSSLGDAHIIDDGDEFLATVGNPFEDEDKGDKLKNNNVDNGLPADMDFDKFELKQSPNGDIVLCASDTTDAGCVHLAEKPNPENELEIKSIGERFKDIGAVGLLRKAVSPTANADRFDSRSPSPGSEDFMMVSSVEISFTKGAEEKVGEFRKNYSRKSRQTECTVPNLLKLIGFLAKIENNSNLQLQSVLESNAVRLEQLLAKKSKCRFVAEKELRQGLRAFESKDLDEFEHLAEDCGFDKDNIQPRCISWHDFKTQLLRKLEISKTGSSIQITVKPQATAQRFTFV